LIVFAFAGLACSAFFPLSVSLLSRRFPGHAAFTGSLMVASLMLGVGMASFSIGPLHARWPLATIYLASALYPAIAWVVVTLMRPSRRVPFEPPAAQTDIP
jgi:predicted MFS family arabinose efflux permease